MMNRRNRTQIRVDCLQVLIGHISICDDRHNRAEVASPDFSGSHHLQKKVLVAIRNTGWIRRDVGAGNGGQRAVEREAAGERHGRLGLPTLLRRIGKWRSPPFAPDIHRALLRTRYFTGKIISILGRERRMAVATVNRRRSMRGLRRTWPDIPRMA
jgi:hypothetical protein